jgi:hypothetical protein
MTCQHKLGIIPLTLGRLSYWWEVYPNTLGILTSSVGNLSKGCPNLWYTYWQDTLVYLPMWAGHCTPYIWQYPTDWKSTWYTYSGLGHLHRIVGSMPVFAFRGIQLHDWIRMSLLFVLSMLVYWVLVTIKSCTGLAPTWARTRVHIATHYSIKHQSSNDKWWKGMKSK